MFKQVIKSLIVLAWVGLLITACQPAATVTEIPIIQPSPTVSSPVLPTASLIPKTAPTPEAVWIFPTGGSIWGTAAIKDGTVYFGSDDGNLYAVDMQNGSLKWKFLTQGMVRSRPAIFSDLVYIASDDGYLYAVEALSGTQVWRTDIGNFLPCDGRKLGTSPNPTTYDYLQSSPVFVDGQIYIGSLDGNIYALAADTGKINWSFKTGNKVRATPTLADGVLYIGSWDESMYALDARNGHMLWQTPVGGEVQTTALVANGLVYTASRKASTLALDAQTGETIWEYDGYGRNMWVESSPQLKDGVIYIGSAGSKVVLGLDSQTGKVSSAFFSQSFHWSIPSIAEDILYIGGTSFKREVNKGGLFTLKLMHGKISDNTHEYWYFPVLEQESLEGNWSGVSSSPVIVDGVVYFGGLDAKLYAVSTVP